MKVLRRAAVIAEIAPAREPSLVMDPWKRSDGSVSIECANCSWGAFFPTYDSRLAQAVYATTWDHVQSAHQEAAEWISASLSLDERRSYLFGWAMKD